ncbi:hypothetical protein AYK20_00120 [Thermoplasmatales archaeon SG8-52-1]|nr:MAG: hypothetical protein AYK20_00120 [Thermoplasmatales archaeon SG8-52-1]
MEASSIDIVVFAPLAPILGVLLFWFIQLVFIESEKYLLSKIRSKHEPFCRFTNFLGILFQTICHALGFTITKSGISNFYIDIDYGKVAPKKERKGIFEWVSNVFLFIGPFFIPAFLLLICLFFLMTSGFEIINPSQLQELRYTFGEQITSFGANLFSFTNGFFNFLFNIDLLHPAHFGFLFLMIFLGMGIRPSYIGKEKKEKVDMLYDLKNIKNLFINKPIYLIILFVFAYIFFYISLWLGTNWYVAFFVILGWLSIISLVSIIIADIILVLIKTTDEISGKWKVFPYLTIPTSYLVGRIFFFYIPTDFTRPMSILILILSTITVTYILIKRKTDKFKTKSDIKKLKKKRKGVKDG